MDVAGATELRRRLRKAEVHYEVVKNTLVRRAVLGTPLENLETYFKGNTAIAYHEEDPAALAKVLTDFAKENEALSLKGGWLDGELLDEAAITALSMLPGKDALRAKLLSVFIGVPTKFVRTLIAGPTTFVQVLQARQEQLEG